MPEDYKGAFLDAVKIAGVGALTFILAPWIDETFPDVPAWIRFAVPAFAGVFLLLVIYVFASGRAHLEVVWRIINEPEVDVDNIVAKISTPNDGEGLDLFEVSVKYVRGRGLGRLALRMAVWSGGWVRVSLLHSDLTMGYEGDLTKLNSGDIKFGNDCSAYLKLKSPIVEPGTTWNRVRFRFRGRDQSSQTRWTADHRYMGDGKFAKVCAKLIKVDAKVVSVVESWS